MTTLAAFQGNGWAVIAADSRATDDTGRVLDLSNHKIVENGGYLIAVSGSSRGGNIAQQGWNPPKPPLTNDINKLDVFMTKKFIPSLRKAFINAGFDGKEDGDAAWQDSGFLVAVNGVIYPISNDYSWDRDSRGIYYSGSGGDIALGAMDALEIEKAIDENEVRQIMYRAIESAIKYDAYTSGPIHVKIQYAR